MGSMFFLILLKNLLVINQEIDTDLVAELRSIDGILVQRVFIKDANHTIDLSHLKTGIYTLTCNIKG